MSKNWMRCSVVGCENSRKSNGTVSYFALPTDDERRNQWLKIIGRTDLLEKPNLKPKSYCVCSAHFERDMILLRPILKLDAIPTKYIPVMSTDDDDTHLTQFEARDTDVSTQTNYSQVNIPSILRIKSPTSKMVADVAVQASEENKDSNIQKPLSLSSNTPRKRTLLARLKDSENKRRKLETYIKKIEKELEAKNNLSLDQLAANGDEVRKKFCSGELI